MIEETFKIKQTVSLDTSAVEFRQASSSVSDDELVKAVLEGDDSAFSIIFERYRKLSVHLIGRFFRQRDEIEDIVQQSFTKIYFSLKDFRGGHEKSFSAWLSRLTVNVCYDELRKRQKRSENLFSDFSDEEQEILNRMVENDCSNVEKNLASKDLAEKLLSKLEAKERVAMTLLYGEDFSVAEVAKIVGWSESNVKTKLFRCRQQLRNIFNKLI
ncbi:MAG TPA: RNA polymerase sigma factor [Pyrinomonadaceae bacterium]|nr:RNA polymerase sigma factor [Pyrinomonadaceae bacterium]